MYNSANNLLYLVNDRLDFSKIESGQLHLNHQSCHLQSVVCYAIRGHATRAYGKGLQVTIQWDDALPDLADIDLVRVGQVVSNLLNNAVKFTEQGTISIQASYHDQQLVIAMADTCIGIAKRNWLCSLPCSNRLSLISIAALAALCWDWPSVISW